MEPWKKVCIYVSVYAMLREFRPIDPFVIKYLTLLPENYTIQMIREDVYPMGSYVSVVFVVVIFLITDYLRYKPIMILNGLSGFLSYSLLLGCPSITILKVEQVFLMLFRASEVAYFTYMFAKINNKDQYQIATSVVRTSVMIGKLSCCVIAQVLITCYSVSYLYLLYLSIIGMILTTIWSLIMPSVQFSFYFYKEQEITINSIVIDNNKIVQTKMIDTINGDLNKTNKSVSTGLIKMNLSEVLKTLWNDFKISYEDFIVFKWSVWWSLSLCGYVLVSQYIQLQWQEIASHETNPVLMNGAAESLATLFSAISAYTIGIVHVDWNKYGELVLSMVAIELGVTLYFLAITQSLSMSYIYYIIFCFTYQTMLTISSAEVAKYMKRDCYGLVFGFNKFIAYILIIIFTIFMVEDTFFSLNIRQQFMIYSIYFVLLGSFFIIMSSISVIRKFTVLHKITELWS